MNRCNAEHHDSLLRGVKELHTPFFILPKLDMTTTSTHTPSVAIPFAGEPVNPANLARAPRVVLDDDLRRAISSDARLDECRSMALECLKGGLNAGSHFHEVWIRDLNTFIVPALEVVPAAEVREALLNFLHFQEADGNLPDGVVTETKHDPYYKRFRRTETLPGRMAMKNDVSSDHETSFAQAVSRYIVTTGDRSILSAVINGSTCLERMLAALEFLWTYRWAADYGLIHNATTIDWHDVQPENSHGLEMDHTTHRAVGVQLNVRGNCSRNRKILNGRSIRPRTIQSVTASATLNSLFPNNPAHLIEPARLGFTPMRLRSLLSMIFWPSGV
jgi:hypothetical protein